MTSRNALLDHGRLDADSLYRWLVEDENWPPEMALISAFQDSAS